MKLIYSTSLVTFTYIHLILIHIIFIHLSSLKAEPSDQHDDVNYYEISDENKKILQEHAKAQLLTKVLGLKEVPKNPSKKAYVPQSMLEEYSRIRDSVREIIPEDRDFYGKINIDDLYKSHEGLWSAVNNYGSQDIEVTLGNDNEAHGIKRFHSRGEIKLRANIPLSGPAEDVLPTIEHLLQPYERNPQKRKQFISVHLRFNLSQELSANPTTVDELKGADLRLSREKFLICEFDNSCDTKPVPLSNRIRNSAHRVLLKDNENGSSNESVVNENKLTHFIKKPRYQRVYILHIIGYDKYNDPITKIHTSRKIDTREATPLEFDIYDIVRSWLQNPARNFGIIVRVTNDDDEFERTMKQEQMTSTALNLKNSTNASKNHSILMQPQIVGVEEHVRLKRAFRSASDNDENWTRKQPSILLYAGPPEDSRYHVKRDHSASAFHGSSDTSEIDGMQADDSEARTLNVSQSVSRRDSRQTNSSNQNTRIVGARSSTATGSQNQKSRGKGRTAKTAEKCSLRKMLISVDQIGWGYWIIAPSSFSANYCAGDCSFPVSDHHNATNHATIQSIFHSVGRVIPRPCCVPTKLSPMAILFVVDGIVQMKSYKDMIVESCGCL